MIPNAPSFELVQSLNWTCVLDTTQYLNGCPALMQCYYDEDLGDIDGVSSCHCGTIARLSNDNFPDCQHHGDMTWLPILMGVLNSSVCWFIFGWGVWMLFTLNKLKQLKWNDITQALLLTMASVMFEVSVRKLYITYSFNPF